MQEINTLFNKDYTVASTNEGHKTASDLIIATAKLIGEYNFNTNKVNGRVWAWTRGWSVDKLDRFYRDAQKDGDPRICWFKMRKLEK